MEKNETIPLGHYAILAKEHWKKYLPRYYSFLESTGRLDAELKRAEKETLDAIEAELSRSNYFASDLSAEDRIARMASLEKDILSVHILLPEE